MSACSEMQVRSCDTYFKCPYVQLTSTVPERQPMSHLRTRRRNLLIGCRHNCGYLPYIRRLKVPDTVFLASGMSASALLRWIGKRAAGTIQRRTAFRYGRENTASVTFAESPRYAGRSHSLGSSFADERTFGQRARFKSGAIYLFVLSNRRCYAIRLEGGTAVHKRAVHAR